MRKPKKYYPAFLGVKISEELNKALWEICDREGVDRSRWVREVLERAVFEKQETALTT